MSKLSPLFFPVPISFRLLVHTSLRITSQCQQLSPYCFFSTYLCKSHVSLCSARSWFDFLSLLHSSSSPFLVSQYWTASGLSPKPLVHSIYLTSFFISFRLVAPNTHYILMTPKLLSAAHTSAASPEPGALLPPHGSTWMLTAWQDQASDLFPFPHFRKWKQLSCSFSRYPQLLFYS